MEYTHYISELTKYITTVAIVGGYPFLFLTVLLEGVPLIGTIVPGHVSIIVAGFLIRVGVFNIWITCALAIIAAILGDYIGFYLGRKYGMPLIDRIKPYFFINDDHIAKVQKLLAKHVGKAMILGRLSPITRALMPFVVGANHTPEKKFWTFNIIGGALWAVGSIILGYVFGAGYQAFAGSTGKFILVAIGAAIIIAWGYRFVNIRFHLFKKYELFILILNLLSLWGLALMLQDAWTIHSPLANFDVAVNIFVSDNIAFAANHFGAIMVGLATWVSNLGGSVAMIIYGVAGSVFFAYRKKWRSASILLLSMASTGVMVTFLKEFFMRARPEDALQILTDSSFPSGHAAMAAAFFLVIAYLFMPKIHSWIKRESFLVLCVVLAIAVGLSRIILNVHWASDVIAGWSLGIFCASASILFVRYVGGIIHKQIYV